MAASGRVVEIDLLKGAAILGVLLIHSEALGATPFFTFVVNHSVPVFLVLFGLNSSLWWKRRALPDDLGTWLWSRAKRIMVPLWASLPIWWAVARWYRPFGVFFPHWLPLAHLAGYTVYIGTGWFVTLIIQLVLCFPLFEWARRRVGLGVVVAASVVASAGTIAARWWIVSHAPETWLGFPAFNYLILAPRFFVHVAFGMWLAGRLSLAMRPSAGAFAVVLSLACAWPLYAQVAGGWQPYLDTALDLPLTVALLTAMRPLAALPWCAPVLAWLGESSYGIYLGQMLTHNAFVFRFGLVELFQRVERVVVGTLALFSSRAGDVPCLAYETTDRWVYTGILLAGGVGAVVVGEALRDLGARLHRAGLPVPDLAR